MLDKERAFELQKIRDTLEVVEEFFVKRDEMNAQVHLAQVRLSPITERVQSAITDVNALLIDFTVEDVDAAFN